ncbi:serine/threonine-protein kinase [Hyalangium versicolor]|uniref:serine/threonine-protein kinase n=1 Tax=Hyalangium versicolor TaxID=2861190 RepID=UPI001CCBBC67|nr:serine/threonine-protein kinase [Hyalangium versicolor]
MRCELCLSEHADDVLCGNVHWSQSGQITPVSPARPQPAPTPKAPRVPAPALDLVGQTLGYYRVVRRLGSGGMGTVYQAEQTRIGARVALKVLHPHLSQDSALRARFYAEAKTVNVVGHPNIVRIFDINEAPGGLHYFVMEYLEGEPLSQLPRPLEPALLTHLLARACEALEAAHNAGVVHRDLKPDNLFVVRRDGAERPSLKVLDFGVAKARDSMNAKLTAVGTVLGTPAYMAPEQWTGQPVDGRADIYALGVTAYLMATGRLPYPRGQVAEIVLSPTAPGPVPPHTLNPCIPQAFSETVLRALARSPSERFAHALEFKQAMEAAMSASTRSRAVPAPSPIPEALRASTPIPSPTVSLRVPRAHLPRTELQAPPTWEARVRRRNGAGEVTVQCTELSRGGLFLCCSEPFPQLFTQLAFTLILDGQPVECVGEVVRHVDSVQAQTWSMSPGVGLQFINPSAQLREHVRRLRPARALPSTPVPVTQDCVL